MFHHKTKIPVAVEEQGGDLCVKLYNWGDKDWLEDRLVEDFEVGQVLCRVEEKDGKEVFFLILPEAKDRSALQMILDQIE